MKTLLSTSSVPGGATGRRVFYKPDSIQATGTSQVQSPKLFSLLHVSFTPCICYKEQLFPVQSFTEPWKHHSCLRGAADLHRNPSNQIMAVASMLFPHYCTKGHQARITWVYLIMCKNSCKASWGFRVVVLWIRGRTGEGIRHGASWLGMTCDSREAHCHTQKIKD